MTLYCGIDLHSNNSVVSIIDETDRVIKEKHLNNNLVLIDDFIKPCQNDLDGVVVESSYNWYWLVDGLMDAGYTSASGKHLSYFSESSCLIVAGLTPNASIAARQKWA